MILPVQEFANAIVEADWRERVASAAIVNQVRNESVLGQGRFNPPCSSLELLQNAANKGQLEFEDTVAWNPELESRFRSLAEKKALKKLSPKGVLEFERLMALRRTLKNPRKGEEIMVEYEQRVLTSGLVRALADYVKFHERPANRSRQTSKT